MVLGIRSKSRKSAAVEVDYLIHVQELKPWPSSQALRSVQSVMLQWENGDQVSGSCICNVGDGKIEFGESFTLPVTLYKEKSRKNAVRDTYQKNNLEFYLYEPRKDKGVKGQLLGSAEINLADYGIVVETRNVSTPLNWKKSFKSSAQTVLSVSIQPCGKPSSSLTPKSSLSREESLENEGTESVPGSVNDGTDEIASFTDDDVDDDVSSHPSHTVNSSAVETTVSSSPSGEKNVLESTANGTRRTYGEPAARSIAAPGSTGVTPVVKALEHQNGSSSPLSSIGSSSILLNSANDRASLPNSSKESASMPILKKSITHSVHSASSPFGYQDSHQESGYHNFKDNRIHITRSNRSARVHENAQDLIKDNIVRNHAAEGSSSSMSIQEDTNSTFASNADSQAFREDGHLLKANQYTFDDKLASRFSQDATRKQVRLKSETFTPSRRVVGVQGSKVKSNELKHVKSVQLPLVSAQNNRQSSNNELLEKSKEAETQDAYVHGRISATSEREQKTVSFSDGKVDLESTIELLKEELREAAAVEIGLYSVAAEHGSHTNKIHAPARRLSRFYFHACKTSFGAKKANAARAAITGLILVSKACGNDVARLTFWLSNSIVLRAIISQSLPCRKVGAEGVLKAKNGFLPHKEENNCTLESFDDWEDPQIFMAALEKFEGWIFSRIVESVWWQNMTPYMQSAVAKGSSSRKANGRKHGLGGHEQGNFSMELWKKAFKDACERLCPARAVGHECGCLPLLARLVMEQLVDRLDVAMFNAILRENAEEMPTDPVSDPISDSKVLPIPAGKSSFGAGAQLKNAIGSWSRWLTDLFGIDDTDAPDDNTELSDHKGQECPTSFKAFRLLNALSDLMMLPFDMLADKSTRKEVCPTFGASLIKRVIYNFVPDEFCPDPIPTAVFEALDYEENSEAKTDSAGSFPCNANPTIYSPPPAASLLSIIGEVGSLTLSRSGSSVLKKSYTSDDELDELDSPMTSIIIDNSPFSPSPLVANSTPKWKGGRNSVRYQLLREVWKDSD
ncbi:hypothetical protein ACFX2F_021550 [Malus domestica]